MDYSTQITSLSLLDEYDRFTRDNKNGPMKGLGICWKNIDIYLSEGNFV